nr:MAG TPA: hypothetical protein [Caudoviricetes sp.]
MWPIFECQPQPHFSNSPQSSEVARIRKLLTHEDKFTSKYFRSI